MNFSNENNKLSLTHWFWIFAITHVIAWTLLPTLIRYNLPLDSMEGTTWGHQLEWGYDKNPFLNAWLTRLAILLSPHSGWVVYLFSQLCMLAAFYSIWELGKKMLPTSYALISVLVLETMQYYNLHGIDFDDNTLEIGLWSLTSLFFYRALVNNTVKNWLFVGCFAALGMMAKYYTLALLAGMGVLLFIDPLQNKPLKTLPPYIGLLLFSFIIEPHVYWLFSHDFITIKYVFVRGAADHPDWRNHFLFPAKFAFEQLEVFLPAVLFMSFLLLGKKPHREKISLTHFNQQFLLYVGLAPFLFTLFLSLYLSVYLRAGWGMPLMSLWGIIFMAYLKPRLSDMKIKLFIATIFIFMMMLLTGYTVSLSRSDDKSSANFPGREIAEKITKLFHEKYHAPLKYVAGSRWVGGNVGFYSKDHPAVFIEWNRKISPWIDVKQMKKSGAVFIWNISDHETLPKVVKKAFPRLKKEEMLLFSWHRNISHLKKIIIGIAILPPTITQETEQQLIEKRRSSLELW